MKKNKMKYSNLLIGLLAAILLFTVSESQGQNISRKSRQPSATSSAVRQKAEVKTALQKTPLPKTQTVKITGWAVEVRSFSAVFNPYVGFNSTGLSIVMLPAPAYQVNAYTSGMQCQFNISDKLLREAQGLLARLQPQKWNPTYGDNSKIAFRVIITLHKSEGPSAVYETIWKGASVMPDDLRQILILKDKVVDDNTKQCQRELQQ